MSFRLLVRLAELFEFKSVVVCSEVRACAMELYCLLILLARSNVPLCSARIPTSFQQPLNKEVYYYNSTTVFVAWSVMAFQSQLISQVGLQCIISEFVSKKLAYFSFVSIL